MTETLSDRQIDWCTKLCRTDVGQLFSSFTRTAQQKRRENKCNCRCARSVLARQRALGKKTICKWHVIHYTRLHNFASLAKWYLVVTQPYHIVYNAMWCIFDAWFCLSVLLAFHHHSPLTVTHRHSPPRTLSIRCVPFAITHTYTQSHRFASFSILCACLMQNDWK